MLSNPGFFTQTKTNRNVDALTTAKANLAGFTPNYYWDFTKNDAIFADVTYNGVMNTPGIVGAGSGPVFNANGLYVSAANKRLTLPLTLGSAYTIYSEFIRELDAGTQQYIWSYDNGSNTDLVDCKIDGAVTDFVQSTVTTASASQAITATSSPLGLGVSTKFATRVQLNNFAFYSGGVQIGVDTSLTMPAATTLRFGVRYDNSTYARGWIKRVAIFNSALSDANMATLTT